MYDLSLENVLNIYLRGEVNLKGTKGSRLMRESNTEKRFAVLQNLTLTRAII